MLGLLPPDVRATLSLVADAAHDSVDDWWIIAGAAAALHGVTDIVVGDIDVLMSRRDAEVVMKAWSVVPSENSGNALFRSAVFGQWHGPHLTVEIMADFDYYTANGWVRVSPATRETVRLDNFQIFVPSRAELTTMFRAFGRPKDLERARLLEQD